MLWGGCGGGIRGGSKRWWDGDLGVEDGGFKGGESRGCLWCGWLWWGVCGGVVVVGE